MAWLVQRLGDVFNNVAEYEGIVAVLLHAIHAGHRHVCVQSDSLLIVRQLRCEWACRSAQLQPLFNQARPLMRLLQAQGGEILIEHIYREYNTLADTLAKSALRNRQSQPWLPS